jgi:hypothetical protein
MQCNIDSRGKSVRLASGGLLTGAGLIVLLLAAVGVVGNEQWWPWVFGGGLAAVGLFQVYEGWSGWCMLRAMGFKTPV